MLGTRRLRRWISGGLLMAMLFMQLATAAYACPQLQRALQDGQMMAAMPGCEGMPAQMDDDQPQLCKAHCDRDAQGTASAVVPDLQPNPAAVTLLMGIIEPVPPLLPAGVAAGLAAGLRRPPGAPPLYLALLVLRN
ncbi:hypothetical protein ABT392_13370 [Paucibacter sp. JuS9]|uniref:hypothetical protein n=1 Tax=Roseateles TaxID=93681 RepID=UPI002FE59D9F